MEKHKNDIIKIIGEKKYNEEIEVLKEIEQVEAASGAF